MRRGWRDRRTRAVVVFAFSCLFLLFVASSSTARRGHYHVGTGRAILAAARSHIGEPYGQGYGWTCSELTASAVAQGTGVRLPRDPGGQTVYGWQSKRMKQGDLVYFAEGGYGITHVGIYAGHGQIVHASNYFMEVVESDMSYLYGFEGWRRIR